MPIGSNWAHWADGPIGLIFFWGGVGLAEVFAGLPHSEELLQNLCEADRWEVQPEGKPKN